MAPLDSASRKVLMWTARAAITRAIGAEVPAFDAQSPPPCDLRAGAFVTLRIKGALRGCIGYPDPDRPLIDVIERCSVSAAISDPRFPSLTAGEWNDVDVELSILGAIEPVDHIRDVIIGRHGLIVESGRRRGLLLPQVALEWRWDAVEFAAQTCAKAGLPRDAWQSGAALFRFEAEVFGETE
jgi:AmmeMemoRadiSam system protein A